MSFTPSLKATKSKRNKCSKTLASPIPADIDKNSDAVMQLACKLSLDTGNFVDVKFYAFSRRSRSGTIYGPKAVYANSWMLRTRANQYFENLFGGEFEGNSTLGPLNGNVPEDQTSFDGNGGLDYESDSDIEDDDDEMVSTLATSANTTDTKSSEKDASLKNDAGLEEAVDLGKDGQDTKEDDGLLVPDQKGRIIVLRNFAYPTWKAFIYYLYTDKVSFARLKSQKPLPVASADVIRKEYFSPAAPLCSPKSMYKLANELGLSDLEKLAKNDMLSKLSSENIISELFSTSTSLYDEIRDMEITFACDKARDAIKTGLPEWLNSAPAESMKRNADTIGHLVQKLISPVSAPAPANPRPVQCPNCSRSGSNFYLRCGSCSYNF